MKRAGSIMAWTIVGLLIYVLILQDRNHTLEMESAEEKIRLQERRKCEKELQELDSLWVQEFKALKRSYEKREESIIDSMEQAAIIKINQQKERSEREYLLREQLIYQNYADSFYQERLSHTTEIQNLKNRNIELADQVDQLKLASVPKEILSGKIELPEWEFSDTVIYGFIAFFSLIMTLVILFRWIIYRKQHNGFV
ncbi:MAG: hypothetical protein DHS20C18_10560 [Saprospiraceae bacterium]|nr:MAG: hypothetical protein DHS20C18_10560 [Saprospiraceae bacterium]